MVTFFKSRIIAVWLILVLVTVLSWESAQRITDHRAGNLIVLAAGFFKVRLIALEFMEVKTAPILLRAGLELWVFGTFAALALLSWQ